MASPKSKPARRSEKPTLRERAVSLGATAARIRRPAEKPEQAEATASPTPSETQVLHGRWCEAADAANRRSTRPRPDTEVRPLCEAANAAEEALLAAPVRCLADLACKVEVLRSHLGVDSLDIGRPFDAVMAIIEGIEELADRPVAEPTLTDPILPAIEAHGEAWASANAERNEALAETVVERWQMAYKALQATTPTTAAGVCALAAHLRRFLHDGGNPIGATFQEEAFTVLLNAIERFETVGGSIATVRPESRDLSAIDSEALAHLFDTYNAVSSQWNAVSCQPICEWGGNQPGSALALAHDEASRAAVARDRIVDELRNRTPRHARDRDMALSVRIKDELLIEGRIVDRELLLDAVKAWG